MSAVGDRPATINTGNGRPDLEGLGLFARFGFADPTTNPIDWTASVGFGGRGVFGTRSNDTYGVGYSFSDLREPRAITIANLANHSQGVEAYYDIGLARSVSLTLDAQWVSGAFTNIDAAFILGFRFNVRL